MKEMSIKLVIDTNALFMSLYNPSGKAAKIIELANEGRLILFSPDSVKEELFVVLQRELDFSENESIKIIESLPISWVDEQIYAEALDKTKVKHEPDKPVEALAIILDCEILTADRHFKNRANIDAILKRAERIT